MQTPHDDLVRRARLGEEMARILSSEALLAAVSYVRAEMLGEWEDSQSTAARENVFFERKALDRLLVGFEHIQNEGLIARARLDQLNGADTPTSDES